MPEDQVATVTQPLDVARNHARQFFDQRRQAAETSAQITILEGARTVLRHEIVQRLMKEPNNLSKTVATDQARTSPEYVAASKKIVDATQRWEILFASAEHERMLWKIVTLEVSRQYERDNAEAELIRLTEMIEQRIRTLKQEY